MLPGQPSAHIHAKSRPYGARRHRREAFNRLRCESALPGTNPSTGLNEPLSGIALPSTAYIVITRPESLRMTRVEKTGENRSRKRPNTDSSKMCEDEVRLGLDNETIRRKLLRILGEFQDICSGRLGRVGVAKQRIELTCKA